MNNIRILVQITVIIAIVHKIQTLEQSIIPCPKNSPNIADCITKSIELLKPQIGTGVFGPTLVLDENLGTLLISEASVNRNLNLKLFNMRVTGLKNFKIQKLRINPDKFKLEIIVFFPHVDGTGTYDLRWNLGILALQGNGNNNVALDNITAHIKMAGTRYARNGVEYLKIDNAQVKIKSADMKVYFDNLFKGQKALERSANDVINQNIDILKGDVFPVVEQVLAQKLQKISNQIFASAPYQEFFP